MKIVVIGGSGLIGSKLVRKLGADGHDVLAASPATGVDTVTGTGLAEALAGAQVVVDVSNSPSFEPVDVLRFFETSTRNLLAAEAAAGVGHHVVLSIVGADRLPGNGYMRAKVAQEKLIGAGSVPYTVLRSTQFFEFAGGIAQAGTDGDTIRLSPALLQPVAADDVVAVLADVVPGAPANGTVEVAGPERIGLDVFVRRFLLATGTDGSRIVSDVHARYFGAELDDRSLTPGDHAHLGGITFARWLDDLAG